MSSHPGMVGWDDPIERDFLAGQPPALLDLADSSDLLDVEILGPRLFRVAFHCRGHVREPDGTVRVAEHFEVGFRLAPGYLTFVNPVEVVTWLGPANHFHPNQRGPFVCLGPVLPATPAVDLVFRSFELIVGRNVCFDERDALRADCCAWVRANPHRYPVDPRPLRWRAERG